MRRKGAQGLFICKIVDSIVNGNGHEETDVGLLMVKVLTVDS